MVETHAGVIPSEISALAKVYRFHDDEVAAFLAAHPPLVPLLIEARPIIARYFGETGVRLQVVYDPEGDEDDAELFAFIETRLGVDASMALLDRLDHEWWIAHSRRASCLLAISLRYV